MRIMGGPLLVWSPGGSCLWNASSTTSRREWEVENWRRVARAAQEQGMRGRNMSSDRYEERRTQRRVDNVLLNPLREGVLRVEYLR